MSSVRIKILATFLFLFLFHESISQGIWQQKSNMPTARKEITDASAVLNGKIYVLGGTKPDGTITDAFESYDPMTDTWDSLAPFPIPVWRASLASVNGVLFGMGGYQSLSPFPFNPSNKCYAYDTLLDTWIPRQHMFNARGSAASVTIDKKVYLIGGTNANALNSMHIYNSLNDTWSIGPSMSQVRSGHTATVIDGKIYAAGGYFLNPGVTALSSGEVLDTALGTWAPIANMPLAKLGITSTAFQGQWYVLGNTSNNNLLRYNTMANAWVQEGPMPENVNFAGAQFLNDSIYLFGGGAVNLSTDGIDRIYASRPSITSGTLNIRPDGNIRIYPNPGNGNITIEMDQILQKGYLELINIEGEIMIRKEIQDRAIIHLESKLPPGIFFLRVESGNEVYTSKLLIR